MIPVISEDEGVLRQIFRDTYGATWTNNENWCGYKPVSEWYGVSAEDGTVLGLDLSYNNLKGDLSLYGMYDLEELNISGNDLNSISISDVPLDNLSLEDVTAKRIEINSSFWGNGGNRVECLEVSKCEISGVLVAYGLDEIHLSDCTVGKLEPSDSDNGIVRIVLNNVVLTTHKGGITVSEDIVMGADEFYEKYGDGDYVPEFPDEEPGYEESEVQERLRRLYEEAGGSHWTNNNNWCTDKPVGEWYGITTDESGNITGIDLSSNNLTGELRIEEFPYLKDLDVSHNGLSRISIYNTSLEEVVLDDCVDGDLDVRGVPYITVINNYIDDFTLRTEETEGSVSEYESLIFENCIIVGGICVESPLKTLLFENCLAGGVGQWGEEYVEEITLSNTTLCGDMIQSAIKVIITDSEVVGNMFLDGAESYVLTDCFVGGLFPSNEMGSMTMTNVVTGEIQNEKYVYNGSVSGYHDFRKLENERTMIDSYDNDRFNLRYILLQNFMPVENSVSLENWFIDRPISEWSGVSVNADGDVVAIDLSGKNLGREFIIFAMPHLSDLNISGNQFDAIRLLNTDIESLNLDDCISEGLGTINIKGVDNISVSGARGVPTLELGGDYHYGEEPEDPCRLLTVSDCNFYGDVLSGYVETLVIKNSEMGSVGGRARTATVEGCVMTSCGICSDYLYFKESEAYEWWSAGTEVELVLENSSVSSISSSDIGYDGTVTLTNATLKNNGITKTFTLPAMSHDAFSNLLEENGL